MKSTCQSEVGKIKSVFIKRPWEAFISDKMLATEWEALNFLSKPDFEKAVNEYKAFENLVRKNDPVIQFFPEDNTVSIDSIYCRDASLATDAGMIICTMGKPGRANEPEAVRKVYEKQHVKILGSIQSPGTVEGGDVAWLNEKTLAVGHTYRTNEEGIRQLKAMLTPLGIQVVTVQLPHYKGPSDVFHLMSILSPVDHDLAVVYSPLMPIAFRTELLVRGYSLIEVPDEEFDSMGCNVLAIAPRQCVIVAGNPKTKKMLEHAGCTVFEYQGSEISVKGGGGPTCLTRPMLREI